MILLLSANSRLASFSFIYRAFSIRTIVLYFFFLYFCREITLVIVAYPTYQTNVGWELARQCYIN